MTFTFPSTNNLVDRRTLVPFNKCNQHLKGVTNSRQGMISRFKGYRSVLPTTNRSMNLIKTGPSHPPSPPRGLQPRGLCDTSVSSIMSRTGRTRGLRPEGNALGPMSPPKTHEQLWPTNWETNGNAFFRKKLVLRICGPYVKAAGQDPILTAKIWTKPLS
ncbi:hypothetical protein V496_01468 [Pseudogymnoascus sp. VKM F-4515 (FW-2607)]|nr:hypothetical protein V496_01468 [Pseudogymnoascus sp. VKM F-4515 (FW-2607)]